MVRESAGGKRSGGARWACSNWPIIAGCAKDARARYLATVQGSLRAAWLNADLVQWGHAPRRKGDTVILPNSFAPLKLAKQGCQ